MTDFKDKTPDPTRTGTSTTPSNGGSTQIERDAKAGADTAKQAAETARQRAGELGGQARQAASDAAADAKRHARTYAEGQKDEAAGRVEGVADALRSAAGSLDDQDQPAVASYARQAATGLDRVSDALASRSVDDLMETVEDFARRQPVAFLGGAVLTGFVLSRFAKSSAERRHDSQAYDTRAYDTGPGRYSPSREGFGAQTDPYNPAGITPEARTGQHFPRTTTQETK